MTFVEEINNQLFEGLKKENNRSKKDLYDD